MSELTADLNRLADTQNLDAQGAANALAGTTNLDLVAAINHAAGTSNLELNGAVRALALAFGVVTTLDANLALSSVVSTLMDAVLLESGDYFLLESGDKLLLEDFDPFPDTLLFPSITLFP